ncbi:MAG TPA: CCA tRNA nucleotidyltransferase, partial [Pirellulaceae bacterium]|nr:CCA tRNA nucleotidyltransferase [Pirellulaceae bacterium]
MAEETTHYTPHAARQFATEVVAQLRDAGFEALWAGGCVRDQLLGHTPKDYDVATSARPEQIRNLFGHRRTLAIGASFGVITVIGTKASGQLDVATFRRDAGYSDGRRPDSVTFSSAEEDAQRRDFTINGLFFDPLTDQVIDYVGGQDDLRRGIVRAIRDPYERFREDKLRMLRAVRFTACFNFAIDPPTLAAMRDEAHAITIVSGERIAAEMRRMLVHSQRAKAVELLSEAQLLVEILPEAQRLLANR